MILYVILFFIALCIGMATSVYAFGTGGKRKKIFEDIYFSVEEVDCIGVVYTKNGDYSAILRMENPVQKYSANIDSYYEFTQLFTAICQTLGEGYAIHKQDVFTRKQFKDESTDKHEFLSEAYFRYYEGREYTDSSTACYPSDVDVQSAALGFRCRGIRLRQGLGQCSQSEHQLADGAQRFVHVGVSLEVGLQSVLLLAGCLALHIPRYERVEFFFVHHLSSSFLLISSSSFIIYLPPSFF